MQSRLIGLVVFLWAASPLPALGPLEEGRPADVGMSAEMLRQGVGLFEKAVDDDDLRGAVLLVARQGKIVLHEALGWRDKEKRLPMEKGTLFHVASNTKPVVAAAVLMLTKDGRLELDAEVRRYLPAFDNDKSRAIQLRHLLTHTSGLRIPTIFLNPLVQKSAEQPDAPSLRIEADRFAAIGLVEPPGKTYSYNNPGYNILGALIEVVSQQPLETFLATRLYGPLGMLDTFHQDRPEMAGRRACVYTKTEGAWKVTYRPGDPPRYPFVRASGGMITTAADYAKFLQLFVNAGRWEGRPLLKPETVRMATAAQTRSLYSPEEQKQRTSFYGFGWNVSPDGVYSHGGSDGTYAWVDPANQILGIVFTQSPGGRNPRSEFMERVRQSLATTAPSPPAVKEPVAAIPGALVIAGGGALPEAVRDRFVELAGGKNARLVVLPTASALADGSDTARGLEIWKQREVASVVNLHTRNREEANSPDFVKPLTEATGVWLGGGDQSRLVAAYRDTAVEQELRKLLARGGVIGGTSASAAVMSPVMITGGNPSVELGPGFGFLPGVVIDQHFLKRNRVNRLLGALGKLPGHVGLGIDEETAVVVESRSLTVLGKSYALVCLPASSRRPLGIQVLKAGERADLIALSRAAVARARLPFPPETPQPPRLEKGALVIGGGGRLPELLWKRYIELAGGPDSVIVVVPTAMEDPVPTEPREALLLRKAGARNVRVLHTRHRHEAEAAGFLAPLHEAKGVWFTGGRQWRFVDAYQDTAAERAFHDVLRRGGVIGGSSAGASIQSEYMPRGDPLGNRNIIAEGYERGFGFLKGVAVDQHFFARRRQGDMTELMAAYPQLLGLGIDEGTALIVQGPIMEVVGTSKVAVYDRRKPLVAGERDYEELPAGTRYDLVTRQRVESRPEVPK